MSSQNLSTLVLRIGIASVYLWFGIQQFLHVDEWTGYLPEWTNKITFLTQSQFIYVNATMEIILVTFLLIGFFTRISAFILAIHLAIITYEMGFTAVGVRDFGLTMATLAIALAPVSTHSIDAKYMAFLKNKFPGFGSESPHSPKHK